jgi:hypothetical protein
MQKYYIYSAYNSSPVIDIQKVIVERTKRIVRESSWRLIEFMELDKYA